MMFTAFEISDKTMILKNLVVSGFYVDSHNAETDGKFTAP